MPGGANKHHKPLKSRRFSKVLKKKYEKETESEKAAKRAQLQSDIKFMFSLWNIQ